MIMRSMIRQIPNFGSAFLATIARTVRELV